MYKKLVLASAAALMVAMTAFGAQALPVSTAVSDAAASNLTLVAGGCGPGFHRGPRGGCRPNGAVVVAPRRVIVAPHVCPRGFHWRGRCVR